MQSVWQLFSDEQRAQLSFLKYLIKKERNKNIQKSLMLAFYNTLSICNLTFHETPHRKGLGGHGFGFYYRYRMAKTPYILPVMYVFERKVRHIINGKDEMAYFVNEGTIQNLQVRKGNAAKLSDLPKESVDYIYTDPPYGAKIQYLDLSTMWNAWLDLPVSEEDFESEAIIGGEHEKTKDDYNSLISKSIEEMFRVLKFDRWLSFVFAHKDPQFWDLILTTAQKCGFEYIGTVVQGNGQTSFKKRQNPFTILSGELIMNFCKRRNPKAVMTAGIGMALSEMVLQTMEGVVAKNNGATFEQINNELIVRGLEMGFLHLLAKEYEDLTPFLDAYFDYDPKSEKFFIKKNAHFKTGIDVSLRAKYYVVAHLRQALREGRDPSFDEIVLETIPLLKNGTTPDNQTVLSVLKEVAYEVGDDCWRLLPEKGQQTLF